MDKIDENYIQKRIHDSRKNWYIYFYRDIQQKDIGIIEAKNEKMAYIKLFDKHAGRMMKRLLTMNYDDLFLQRLHKKFPPTEGEIRHATVSINRIISGEKANLFTEDHHNRMVDMAFTNDKEDRAILDEMKYEYIKGEIEDEDGYTMYIKKIDC